MDRRKFLSLGVKTAAGLVLGSTVPAWASTGTRTLSFYHTHTKKFLDITYCYSGRYDPVALAIVNRFLADFRTGEVHPIDPGVLDILHRVLEEMGCAGTYEVISGYRSPRTNQMLRRRSKGVARHSLHMDGKAIDIRLTGQSTRQVRDCALALKTGGVGYYATSNFVHLDTGRVRTW
jgi:uncharacterized protein YcbK (DUF882 family)